MAKEKVPVILRIDFQENRSRNPFRAMAAMFPGFTPPPRATLQELPARVREDRARRLKEEQANASVLHKKGVTFAFCTQGIESVCASSSCGVM